MRIKFQIPKSIPPQCPIQITIFPGFFPRLTSTRPRRWWRNNTDTWSYSICALGRSPKSIIISRPGCWKGRTDWGVPRVSGHHSAGEDFPKIMSASNGTGRKTYLLPGSRLPCAKFDVSCNQLVSSCKQEEKVVLAQKKKEEWITIAPDEQTNFNDFFSLF